MEKYVFLILASIVLVGAAGLFIEHQSSATGAAFLSERLCQEGFTSTLYVEKNLQGGYFKPTVVCVSGDRVPALREKFELDENNADKYDAFRTDPYRHRRSYQWY